MRTITVNNVQNLFYKNSSVAYKKRQQAALAWEWLKLRKCRINNPNILLIALDLKNSFTISTYSFFVSTISCKNNFIIVELDLYNYL